MPADPTPAAKPRDDVQPSDRRSFLDRWFRPVRVPHDAPAELAALARRGSIVFVMRSAGVLNFLYLGWLLRRLGLPPLRVALGLKGIMPWLAGVRPGRAALEEAVAAGHSALVFLNRASGPDPFPLLVALQRASPRPLLLVPGLLVWTRRPQKLKPTLGEILFGTPDIPSRLANAVGFLLNHRRAVLRLGAGSDLATFVRERAAEPDAVLGRKIRGALHLHLASQVRSVVGPPLKSAARVREQVLRDKTLRAQLAAMSREGGRPLAELQAEAGRDLREIASRYSPIFVEIVRPILSWLFARLYDGIELDEEGLARVKSASADAPVVFCPSHKSHVDYLVLSWILYENGLTAPHVAAGINLAFWPFGAIARRGGAFFIRRSVRGDRVYTATLRAYVKQLLRDRVPQEFYPEGGRSRSGKLLVPKTGLFSMEVDAWLEQAAHDVVFVPVAIDYERLVEGRSYVRELQGAEKGREDLRALLRARKALRRRYGRLSIQFERPISLRAFARERLGAEPALALPAGVEPEAAGAAEAEGPPGARRQLVQALANRVVYGIASAVTVTPVGLVATALLAHTRRGIPAEEVARRVELLRRLAAEGGTTRFARDLAGAPADPREPGPIAAVMAGLAGEGLVRVERAAGETIYQVPDDRRPLLDYYKNVVLHRFVAVALIAAAVRERGGAAELEDVKARTRWLSRLLKLEFVYRDGASFDDTFASGVALLLRLGVLARADVEVAVGGDRAPLEFVAALLLPFLEAYRLVGESAQELDRASAAGFDRRALVRSALERGRAAHAAGRIALRESVSKATFENATEWLFQQGAVVPAEDGRSRLGASWREKRLPELLRDLERLAPQA